MAGPPPPSAPWTAPPPPPPSWAPRPPKPHRRRVWIYLLVGSVVVILGGAVASGTIWINKVKPPIDAANDYLHDISNGDYQAAFDQLCAQEKVDGSPQSLARTVDSFVFSSHARLLDRGYASSGSVRTFTSEGPGVANARSSAGPISPGSATSSP